MKARQKYLPIAQISLLMLIPLIAYLPALHGGFILDDDLLLTGTPLIKDPHGFFKFWTTTQTPDYLPLMSDTFWLEWRLWGMNPMGYHVTNLMLHIVSALLLWRVLRKLKIPGAWLAALVWAVHPVNVRSVAWIAERKNTLSMVFYLLSLLCFLKAEGREARKWYLGSLGAFVLALLSKASVVMLPVALLLCVWWQRHRLTRQDFLRTLPFFGLSALFGLIAVWFQYNREIKPKYVTTDPFLFRLAGAGWDIWFYLEKALFPVHLAMIYPRWKIPVDNPLSYLPLLLVVLCLVMFWQYRTLWGRPWLFASAYFVVSLLPVLGFVNMAFFKSSLVSDHLQYIAIIGVIALAVGGATAWVQNWGNHGRQIGRGIAGIAVLALCLLTWQQGSLYGSREALARDTLAQNPDSFWAHGEAANAALARGDLNTAIAETQEVIRLNPKSAPAHNNLGVMYAREGRWAEADEEYRRGLAVRPDMAALHRNLADALTQQGQTAEAAAEYAEAQRLASGQ